MRDKFYNQAFLILTNNTFKKTLKLYHDVKKAAEGYGDVFFLYHAANNVIPVLDGVKIEPFSDDILTCLNYIPLKKTLLPGSNHFPILNFYLKKPYYSHYWCIEDDVAFNGSWEVLFKHLSSVPEYDFVSSHIRQFSVDSGWAWWCTFKSPVIHFETTELLAAFNPIYRIANDALNYIDMSLKSGCYGHHEVLLPTLLNSAGFTFADFGTDENYVTPNLSYCTVRTMRDKPIFLGCGFRKNMIYHPVKPGINRRHILMLMRSAIVNGKRYFKMLYLNTVLLYIGLSTVAA